MYKYTLGFIKRKDEILMVNRYKKPWKGAWNGVGGKIEGNETPLECIIREVQEETGISINHQQIKDQGVLTWNTFDAMGNGLHIFLITVADDYIYPTPRAVDEGILDWKKIDWICDFDTIGMAHNIPYFLPDVLGSEMRYHFHCTFEGKTLKSVTKEEMISC